MIRYAITIFVSAFLLFQVQPLIGRFILPWFGGGPSIWTTCMLFFQLLLLGGYLYSHWLSTSLGVRAQVVMHTVILAASLLFLPIIPSDGWKPVPERSPSWQILLLLLATVGGPYFVLSTTGPLLQRWFSRTSPDKSPYRLYALSNLGSLLALLSYPFVFEPWMRLRQQAVNWTVAYFLFAGLVVWCAIRLWKQLGDTTRDIQNYTVDRSTANTKVELPAVDGESPIAASPRWWQMLLWVGLSACGSALLLATTNQLCIDVATVPFLWVLPLSIYLLSFIICFDNPRWYDRRVFGLMLLLIAPAACWVLAKESNAEILDQVLIYSVVLFACCMACHGELVQSRPHPQHLTLFFVLISAGGALGGLFVALIATKFFLGYWEYQISLMASVVVTLSAWCAHRIWLRKTSPGLWLWVCSATAQVAALGYYLYDPLAEVTTNLDRNLYIGVYSFLQMVGLATTVAFEKNVAFLKRTWIVLTVPQLAWLFGYAFVQWPEWMTWKIGVAITVGTFLPPLMSSLALGIIADSDDRSQRIFLRIVWLIIAVSYLTAFWFHGWFEVWQLEVVASACVVSLLLDAVIRKFRSSKAPSWGLWFWLPAGSLIALLGIQLVELIREDNRNLTHVSRNFYGVLKVRYKDVADSKHEEFGGKFTLSHGQIVHGFQFTNDYWKRQPTTYYGRDSGIGIAIRLGRKLAESADQHALRVGVVGLGTGSLAAYGESGDHFRFYEINPDVLALSDKIFSYLKDSPAETKVVLGDARITMEREIDAGQSQQFDVLAIDAFSSDAIPVHLLTTECGAVYRQQLRPGGILALHVSNRFLDLVPVARGLAESLGWQAIQIDSDDDDSSGVFGANWILITNNEEIVSNEEIKRTQLPWDKSAGKLSWTDDYSGLWRVLSF